MCSMMKAKKNKTIKGQITFWFSSFFLVLLAILIAFIIVVSEVSLRTNTKDRLAEIVNNDTLELEYLESEYEFDNDEGDHFVEFKGGYLEIDDDFVHLSNGISISLYDGNELIYGQNPIENETQDIAFADQETRTIKVGQEKYYLFDAKVEGENLSGLWVRGVIATDADVTVLNIIFKIIIIFVPLLAVIAIIGGYVMSRRLLKPFDEISHRTNSIRGANDLTKRVDVPAETLEASVLKETINLMLQRLQESFDAEKQFTSNASHELRTPVSVITAECEFALESGKVEDLREALTVISRQNEKMTNLIEEMLMFTRIEQKTIGLQLTDVSLGNIADEVLEEQALIWDEKEISVHRIYEEDITVDGDKRLLARLIQNLVQNAFKYGRQGGNIWIRIARLDDKVVLSIEDDGIGIPEEDQHLIWNRFYRGDSSRSNSNSTGLGLALVKEIAELHGGKVGVESENDKGSKFYVEF